MKTYDVVVDENGEIRGVEHETARMPEYLMPRVSVRDYMAAAALTGLLSEGFGDIPTDDLPGVAAELAYDISDAMLKERNNAID